MKKRPFAFPKELSFSFKIAKLGHYGLFEVVELRDWAINKTNFSDVNRHIKPLSLMYGIHGQKHNFFFYN